MNKKINQGIALAIILIVAFIFAFLFLKTSRVEAPAETKNQNEVQKNIPESIQSTEKTSDENENSIADTNKNSGEEQIGYLKSAYGKGGKKYLAIDYIQWLNGKEAIKAAIEDKKCFLDVKDKESLLIKLDSANLDTGLGDYFGNCAPNSYYIRNQNKLIRTFEVSNNAVIQESAVFKNAGDGNDYAEITWDELAKEFKANDNYWKDLPASIEIKDNIITKITQSYLP